MERKRGQGHIEVIISFTLFVSFIVAILFFLRPTTKSREVSLNSVENALMQRLITNLSYFSVKAKDEFKGCFCFDSEYDIAGGVIVMDKNKNKFSAKTQNNKVCINTGTNYTGNFFYVYFSEDFENGDGCSASSIKAEFGSLRELQVISNELLNKLKSDYETNYESLKSNLGLVYDFKFEVVESDGVLLVSTEKNPPFGRPVYSRDTPIEIVYKNGEIKYGIMRVFAW